MRPSDKFWTVPSDGSWQDCSGIDRGRDLFFSPETEEAVPEIRSFRVESSLFSNIQHPLTECDGPSVSHQSTKIVPSGYLT